MNRIRTSLQPVRRRRPGWASLAVAPAMALAAALVLAGCTSGTPGSAASGLQQSAQGTEVSNATAGREGTTDVSAPSLSSPTAESTTQSSTPPPPPPATVTAVPANGAADIDPLAPITVTVADGLLDAVTVTNPDGEQVPGTLAPDKLSWTATPVLGYGKTYTVTASATNKAGVAAQSQSTFTTVVPDNYTAARVYPLEGMTMGVGQPVAVYFDEPIVDKAAAEAAITVTTTPAQPGGFRWVDDQEVRWRPSAFWAPGTTVQVAVHIYGKDMGGRMYGQQDAGTSFAIGRSMIAEINDQTHQMVVRQDGQVINTIPVSMGSNQFPTYNGIHIVAEKYESKIMDSRTWGLTGDGAYRTEVFWATRISSTGEFVHAAPWSEWAQGSENVSHGCVNVSTDSAIWFYNTFIPGDPVIISNTVGPSLEVWDGFGDWQLPFDQYVA